MAVDSERLVIVVAAGFDQQDLGFLGGVRDARCDGASGWTTYDPETKQLDL